MDLKPYIAMLQADDLPREEIKIKREILRALPPEVCAAVRAGGLTDAHKATLKRAIDAAFGRAAAVPPSD
jgi:hypothetical protein